MEAHAQTNYSIVCLNQVRVAYVLKKHDLERALVVLGKALEAYPGRVEDEGL